MFPFLIQCKLPNTWYLQCNCSRFNVFGQILTLTCSAIDIHAAYVSTANFPPLILHMKKARTLHLTQRFTTSRRTLQYTCMLAVSRETSIEPLMHFLVVSWRTGSNESDGSGKGVFPLGYSMCSSRSKTSVPARTCDSSLLVPVGGVSHETSARKLAIGCLIKFCWARMTARNRTSGLLKRWKLLVYRAGR